VISDVFDCLIFIVYKTQFKVHLQCVLFLPAVYDMVRPIPALGIRQ
jgi:hypothetical protein